MRSSSSYQMFIGLPQPQRTSAGKMMTSLLMPDIPITVEAIGIELPHSQM